MIQRFGGVRSARIACAAAATIAVFAARPVAAQTWVGPGVDWNTGTNWSPVGVPNSPTANVSFTGIALGNVNISSSVQAQSLSFSNPTGSYTLSSSAGAILSSLTAINVAAGVANQQTIQLAPNSGGNLLFASGNNLTINNNSIAPGTTLLIGQNTVIGTPGTGGLIFNGSGTTEIAGTFATVASGNHIVGGLTKNGTGTLILSNPNNVYFGGTNVNGGTLQLGSGTAIPTGSNVTVASGATFNTGGLSNGDELSSTNAIGALTLNGGTFRVPSGNGDYWLNQLTMTGGTVDFTGSGGGPGFWLHFTGAGAGILTNPSTVTATWIGAGNSRIQNDTAAPLTIAVSSGAVPSGIDLDAGIILSGGGTNNTFIIAGLGTMRLTNVANTANLQIGGLTHLRVDDMAALGSGTVTINGGYLSYGGNTIASNKPLFLQNDARIEVLTNGTNLTLNGAITETSGNPSLIVFGAIPGASTLTLTNTANNYSGATIITRNAVLAIPTIANGGALSPIGRSSNAPLNLQLGFPGYRGTLLLTGTNAAYSTDRGATLFGTSADGGGGVIGVQNAATNLTWSGQITGAGSLIKTGPGTLTLSNGGNNYTGGTYIEAGRLALGAGTAVPVSGNVAVYGGAELNLGSVSNTSGSAIGEVAIFGGTLRVPSGSGDYYLNRLAFITGTVDFTGTNNFWMHFVGAGAGINVLGSTSTVNLVGAANSRLQNDTAVPLPIAVAQGITSSGIDLDLGITLSGSGSNPNFTLTGFGLTRLTNPGNTANLRVQSTYLRVDDVTSGPSGFGVLGSGTLTFDNGILRYGGLASATLAKPFTLAASAGLGSVGVFVQNTSPGTVLTMSGVISQTGSSADSLNVDGVLGLPDRGVVALAGANTYTGATNVFGLGILSVPTVTNAGVPGPLGAASASPSNLVLGGYHRGTLRLTGNAPTYSTNRGLTVSDGTSGLNFPVGGVIDVANAATNLTIGGQITGPGTFIKDGAGSLTLTNTSNNNSGGTIVSAGRLAMGVSGPVIPTNSNLTVLAGAIFDAATFANSPASPLNSTPIGTLNLQGGTFLATGGPTGGDTVFELNRLEMTGGTVNFSPGQFYRFQFVNSGAGIRTSASSVTSTLIGPANHLFANGGAVPLPIDVALGTTSSGIDLDVGLGLHRGSVGNPTFLKTGSGTMRLTNITMNTADIVVALGRLRVDDVAANGGLGAFGTGTVTLDGGAFLFIQPSATSMKPLTFGPAGGGIEVANAGTNLTIGGLLTGAGALIKSGPGVITLSNTNNSYSGGTVVNTGRLDIASDIFLGSPTGQVIVNPLGTLRFTASTSTARTFSFFNGTVDIPTGVTLTMNGAQIGGGFLRGTGTYNLTGGTALTGVTTFNSTTMNVTGPASAANFANNGALTVNSGQTFAMTYATNGASGLMTVNGTANVGDFTSYGRVAINPGGTVNNTQSAMSFAGGSVTTIGIYNPANGQVTPGGTLDIGPGGLRVQGGFVRNNGVITGSGNLIIDYLGLVRGAGEIDLPNAPIRINGGQLLAGNSPGLTRVSNFSLVSTGVTGGDFSNATGIAGPPIGSTGTQLSGWSVFEYGNSTNTGGSAVVEGTPAARAIWQFRTVLDSGDYSTPGVPANFNAAQPFTWQIVRPRSNADVGNPNNITPVNTVALISIFDTATMQTVPLTTANLNAYLRFDDSLWNWGAVPVNERGTFAFVLLPDALGAANRVIGLTYTPVPEPGWAMVAAFVVLASVRARRRFTWFRRL